MNNLHCAQFRAFTIYKMVNYTNISKLGLLTIGCHFESDGHYGTFKIAINTNMHVSVIHGTVQKFVVLP